MGAPLTDAERRDANDRFELRTIDGKHSAYCGMCWEPVFRLWVDKQPPDYTTCPLGPYIAQTCPLALGAARRAKTRAEAQARGMTFVEYLDAIARERSEHSSPLTPAEVGPGMPSPSPTKANPNG